MSAGLDDGVSAARQWLESRVNAAAATAAQAFLRETAEALSIASGDATSIRVLSADGKWLYPLASHHPNPAIQRSIDASMRESAERADAGLWHPVINERRLASYDVSERTAPPDASATQADFIEKFPVTRVMGAPVVLNDEVVGGVCLVRFVDQRPFSESDCGLLVDVAGRIAFAIECGRLQYLDPEGLT